MPANNTDLEKRLWDAADQLRANSELKSSEYAVPVLGLIFLRYADYKFGKAEQQLEGTRTGRRQIGPNDYQAEGVLFLPDEARYERLLDMPEKSDVGKAVNDAMEAIEQHNPELHKILPKDYTRFKNPVLRRLLKNFNFPLNEHNGDMFGRIYEYFLGKFAMSEGQKGGEFFTPESIVKLIVEIIEPYQGRIYDPASGSGGMFVWSADFVKAHQQNPLNLSIYGQERVYETVRLAMMNLAVHGLPASGIVQANSYYDDLHNSVGLFDYVMANPPFNVNGVDKGRIKDDRRRFPFGMPSIDNGNYLWIQLFYSALNDTGRAGFVMANSASDARHSELDIRRRLIEQGVVDVMVAIGSNFFYTVTLPCTLWFLDRGKRRTPRANTVLFIDARNIFTQLDRAHREFAPEQLEVIANIVRLYRGHEPENRQGSADLLAEVFPDGVYQDVPGLCRVATLDDIAAQGWSLNPGRYVGVADRQQDDFDFAERLEELHERLELLNLEAHELEERIAENTRQLLEGM
jgi:type I restriction enzyme M protein